MVAILTLLIVMTISIVVTRVATVALEFTGLSHESARFQARSAFTGVGFTTSESERVVDHPVRRRIVMTLMGIGNIGFVTAVSTLILTFLALGEAQDMGFKVVLLLFGLAAVYGLATSAWIDRHLSAGIVSALRRYTDLDVRDYRSLLHLAGDWRVTELSVSAEDWLANRALADLDLAREGVLILGIERADGSYVGAPKGHTELLNGDSLVVYGHIGVLEELDNRRKGWLGDRQHERACEEEVRAESMEPEPAATSAQRV